MTGNNSLMNSIRPNGPQLIQEYFETEGGVCSGNVETPCKNAIKVTPVCSHECEVRSELSEEEK